MDLTYVRNRDFWEKRSINIIKTELLFLHATAEYRHSWIINFTYDAVNFWNESDSIEQFENKLTISFNNYVLKNVDNFERITELEDTYSKIKSTTSVFRMFLDELENYFNKISSEKEELVFDILASHLVTLHEQTKAYFGAVSLNQAVDSESFRMLTSFYNKVVPQTDVIAGELVDLMYDILNWTVSLYGELLDLQAMTKKQDYHAEVILNFARETGTGIYFFLYFAESILDEFDIGEERIDELLEYENEKWNEIRGSENIDNIKTHLLNN
ncbi:hypothetical protein STIUS_v1c01790 [Spiroplasma sp. TIUS-1]|uniref:hypothetical protein n=1 Tax=Spiroplasma sp. TIUS-1 TaxID=216963 RepID=UPI001399420B|nr:hypothetical protein [Spiroplasma sp. TIUS-1]QHX35734.1 hypothetical protein STIUS_v1c01790 [Spiroplasma sp. TIUS-1]